MEDDDQRPIQDTPKKNMASSAIRYDQKPFEATYRDFLNSPDILDCLNVAPLPHGHHAIKAAAKENKAAKMEGTPEKPKDPVKFAKPRQAKVNKR